MVSKAAQFIESVPPKVRHMARAILNSLARRPDVGRSSSVPWPSETSKLAAWVRCQVLAGGGAELLGTPVVVLEKVISMLQETASWHMAQPMFAATAAELAMCFVQSPGDERWRTDPLAVATVMWVREKDEQLWSGLNVLEMTKPVALICEQVALAPLHSLGSTRL